MSVGQRERSALFQLWHDSDLDGAPPIHAELKLSSSRAFARPREGAGDRLGPELGEPD